MTCIILQRFLSTNKETIAAGNPIAENTAENGRFGCLPIKRWLRQAAPYYREITDMVSHETVRKTLKKWFKASVEMLHTRTLSRKNRINDTIRIYMGIKLSSGSHTPVHG